MLLIIIYEIILMNIITSKNRNQLTETSKHKYNIKLKLMNLILKII